MSASAVQATRERRADSLVARVPLSLKPTRARCHAGSGAQLREMCRIDRAGAAASRVFARRPGIHRTERPKTFTHRAVTFGEPWPSKTSAEPRRQRSYGPRMMRSSCSFTCSLLVFGRGPTRLAFEALDVQRLVDGELWTGEPPLQLGAQLGIGEDARERRTQVLELETSAGQRIPVLTRGPTRLWTFDLSDLEAVTVPQGYDQALVACVGGVLEEGPGRVQIYRILTDPLARVYRRSGERPSGRFGIPPFSSKRPSAAPWARRTG